MHVSHLSFNRSLDEEGIAELNNIVLGVKYTNKIKTNNNAKEKGLFLFNYKFKDHNGT